MSTLFTKSRAYAEVHGDHWWILSAKHGLVQPETMLSPYDETLIGKGKALRQSWAKRVLDELGAILVRRTTVVFLAGETYREFLEPALRDLGHVVEVPMRGLGIGKQLAWLSGGKHV